jgi:hypothetical protein
VIYSYNRCLLDNSSSYNDVTTMRHPTHSTLYGLLDDYQCVRHNPTIRHIEESLLLEAYTNISNFSSKELWPLPARSMQSCLFHVLIRNTTMWRSYVRTLASKTRHVNQHSSQNNMHIYCASILELIHIRRLDSFILDVHLYCFGRLLLRFSMHPSSPTKEDFTPCVKWFH